MSTFLLVSFYRVCIVSSRVYRFVMYASSCRVFICVVSSRFVCGLSPSFAGSGQAIYPSILLRRALHACGGRRGIFDRQAQDKDDAGHLERRRKREKFPRYFSNSNVTLWCNETRPRHSGGGVRPGGGIRSVGGESPQCV